MTRPRHRVLLLAGGAVALVIALAFALPPFVSIDAYRPQLEIAASRALGQQVRVGGRLGFRFFPGFHVTADRDTIRNGRGLLIGTAKRANLYFEFWPLFVREFRLSRVDLREPTLYVGRDAKGRPKTGGLGRAAALLGELNGVDLSFRDGSVVYGDSVSGGALRATGIELRLRSEQVAGADDPDAWKKATLKAKLTCATIGPERLGASGLSLVAEARDGQFLIRPIRMTLFGGEAAASLRADVSGAVPRYQLACSLSKFRIERFLEAMSVPKSGVGEMNFTANLSAQGKTDGELLRDASGEFTLRGDSLTLVGADLDGSISRYESSQHFNLVDVGAVFLVGPLGLAATRGYNFAKLLLGSGETTEIRRFVSDWSVERGVAQASDVALATPQNRIALQGGLDFVSETFADVTVAVVDDDGCATLRQTIRGPFDKPEVDKPHVLSALMGPVTKLVKTAKDILPLGPCEAFYDGSVKPSQKESSDE